MVEIERKFLVQSQEFIHLATHHEFIAQGFLSVDPARVVRVRVLASGGKLTVKGQSSPDGTSRFEWEQSLSAEEAQALFALCLPGCIEKTRYRVPAGPHTYEVDVFSGENLGLVIAEIELNQPDEAFERPLWLGSEVTGDPRYYNANLTKFPFNQWGSSTH